VVLRGHLSTQSISKRSKLISISGFLKAFRTLFFVLAVMLLESLPRMTSLKRIKKIKMIEQLNKQYREHKVFAQLTEYSDFYESFSQSVMNWVTQGTKSILNLDTYVYSSMQGTLESIHDILFKGRINDSYSLLRKFYDSTIINIYSNLYLEDNFSLDNFFVTQIENWRKGADKLPEYRIMSQYIKNSPKLKVISDLLQRDQTYKNIRARCNDHTHYSYFHNLMLNNNRIYSPDRIKVLDNFSSDLEHIIIQHLAYIFTVHDHYMMSTDYSDSMNVGVTPEEDSEYWVAPFIQEIYDKLIKEKRPEVAKELKKHTTMKLE
jgi:hypothetical protein